MQGSVRKKNVDLTDISITNPCFLLRHPVYWVMYVCMHAESNFLATFFRRSFWSICIILVNTILSVKQIGHYNYLKLPNFIRSNMLTQGAHT